MRIKSATKDQWSKVESLRVACKTSLLTEQFSQEDIQETVYAVLELCKIEARPPVFRVSGPRQAMAINSYFGEERIRFYCGQWWAARSGWFEGGRVLGVNYEAGKLELLSDFSRRCPVWMWSAHAIYIPNKPYAVHWRGDELHNESGPSVDYRSDMNLWHIDNIMVDKQIVMCPETQTIEQIHADNNEDRRSIRIERYGWANYIRDAGLKQIDRRENDTEGTIEELYEATGHNRLLANCPTGKIACLGVPGDITTCADAQRWLNHDVNVIGRT